MASITLAAYTTEMTKLVVIKGFLNPNEVGGKVKVATFGFTNGSSTLAATSVICLTRLPKGAKVLDLRVDTDNATATSTLAVGYTPTSALVDTNAAAFAAATAASSGATTIGLKANATGTELTEESYLIATVGTAAFGASKKITGYVFYVDGDY